MNGGKQLKDEGAVQDYRLAPRGCRPAGEVVPHLAAACGFILQLGLLQALLTLYLNQLQVLTLVLRAGCLAARGSEGAGKGSCQHAEPADMRWARRAHGPP